MKRKGKKAKAGQTWKAEDLLEELNTEALAYNLEQRRTLRVWMVFGFKDTTDGGFIVDQDSPKALAQIEDFLAKGGEPAGVLLLEQVGPPLGVMWYQKPYEHYDGSVELLKIVRDGLSKLLIPPDVEGGEVQLPYGL